MKLINLLIRVLDNCSLGGDFRVSRHAEICQFDRFSLEINFKEHVVVIMEFPDWVQVKMKLLYTFYNRIQEDKFHQFAFSYLARFDILS